VNQRGQREILGFDVGPAESHDFWLAFLRSLANRGLRGTRLVISDAYAELRWAIAEVLTGAIWQRCSVHFMRNLLALVPKRVQTVAAAWVRTIHPDPASARDQLRKVARALAAKLPPVSALLRSAEGEILTYMAVLDQPLAEAALDEHDQTSESGDRAAGRSRWHLSERPSSVAVSWSGA
jgi:putative transposase